MRTIRLPVPCNHHALINTLGESGALSTDCPAKITIHVPRGCFVAPSAMALLGAWGLMAQAGGTQLAFSGDEGVLCYMSRMDVFQSLRVTYTEYFERHVEAGRFIPMKLVDDSAACKSAVDAICDLVLHQFDNPHQFLPALEWAVNEVVDNILIHAETPVPGVVCAQFFPARERIDIGVCDMGKGLKASLRESFSPRTHVDALSKAVQRGVTRDSSVGMGNGLAGTVEIAKLNGGTFELWSGDSTFRVDSGADSGFLSHPYVPGTGLSLSLCTTRPVDLGDTFIGSPGWTYIEAAADRLTDSGGLRIKDECTYTGTRPPATQLRRKILALLPSFDEPLVLDFQDVSAASSSFLDELLGRLADELGIEEFHRRIRVVNTSPRLRAMSNVVIEQRLSTMSASERAGNNVVQPDPQTRHVSDHHVRDPMESTGIIETVARKIETLEGTTVHHDPPVLPKTSGTFEPVETTNLTDEIKAFVAAIHPGGLYTHQHHAIDRVLQGENTVVATRTSSGKSLIYSLPVLDSLCRDHESTALFLYPQKALANDQLIKLRQAVEAIPALGELAEKSDYLVSRYDGATNEEDRQEIRASVQLVLTNPDMLHLAMLQHHKGWERFFSNLKHVIVDECHEYRGIFGTNVAYILRRLRQLCKMYGSSPTFVATSATVSEPRRHLETLVGVPFTCVGSDQDGSQQGARKFWMISSDDYHYDFGRKLTTQLADEGLSVLTFCPSRSAAERLTADTVRGKETRESYVRVYRAGLLPKDREEIERGLRDKSVRAVYSTNALELGIDIGAIDVVICIGLPQSMMSLWQRAGRAARAGKEGAVILIPADNPIDSYYANTPREYFARDHEPLVLNLTNGRVVKQHYACAAHEAGGREDQILFDFFGESFSALQELRNAGQADDDIFYQDCPHMVLNIRSMGDRAYKLMLGGNKIGEIGGVHLIREAYRNAIYRHGGQAYRVQGIDRNNRLVRLRREHSHNATNSTTRKKVQLKRRYAFATYSRMMIATVSIDVSEFIVNVAEKKRSGEVVKSWPGSGGMPSSRLPTDGTLLRINGDTWSSVVSHLGQKLAHSALQSCERLLSSLFPTVTGPCDIQDFSSTTQFSSSGEADIYLYDLVYDGANLAVGAFEHMSDLLEKSLERLCGCECANDEGCFRCIANPRVEETTSKNATRYLLEILVDVISSESVIVKHEAVSEVEMPEANKKIDCPKCATTNSSENKFCGNCGTKLGDMQ